MRLACDCGPGHAPALSIMMMPQLATIEFLRIAAIDNTCGRDDVCASHDR